MHVYIQCQCSIQVGDNMLCQSNVWAAISFGSCLIYLQIDQVWGIPNKIHGCFYCNPVSVVKMWGVFEGQDSWTVYLNVLFKCLASYQAWSIHINIACPKSGSSVTAPKLPKHWPLQVAGLLHLTYPPGLPSDLGYLDLTPKWGHSSPITSVSSSKNLLGNWTTMSDYEEIKANCLESEHLFEDADFPASTESIYYQRTGRHNWDNIEWKRPGVRNMYRIHRFMDRCMHIIHRPRPTKTWYRA